MYNSTKKQITYLIIIFGIILFFLGLWQYVPKTYSSETPDSVFMLIVVKRAIFPVLGLIVTVIGFVFLKFIREMEEEMQLLRSDLSRLTKMVEKIQGEP